MFGSKADALLAGALVIWMTTVRPDGQPQASPVWFVIDEDEFLVYSRPGAPRLRNLASNPRVALNLDSDEGGDVVTIEGVARVVVGPRADHHSGYLAKYTKPIARLGYTPQQFGEAYSVALRVTTTRWRAF